MGRLRLPLILAALLAAGFYLTLIDIATAPELIAGAVAVLLAAAAFELSREQGIAEAGIDPRWLARAWRVAANLPRHVVLVCAEAIDQLLHPRSVRGEIRTVRFRAAGDGPADTGRRALAEALGSLTPNTIVIGIDKDSSELVVHQLRGTDPAAARHEFDPLGLG